jgi:hypothetical protein
MNERIVAIVIALSMAKLSLACDAPVYVGPTLVIPAEAVARLSAKLDPLPRQAIVAIPASVLTAEPGDAPGSNLTEPLLMTTPLLMTMPMPQRFAPNAPRDLGLYKFEWQDMRAYLK